MRPDDLPPQTKDDWIALEMLRRMGVPLQFGWRDANSGWFNYEPVIEERANILANFHNFGHVLVWRRKP